MQVIPITTPEGLDAIRSEWSQLAGQRPLLSWHWLAGWWRHYGASHSLQKQRARLWVLCVRDGRGRLVGIAPWYIASSSVYGRVVRFLGDGEVCTDHLSLLCAPGSEAAVADALADWLLPQDDRKGSAGYEPWGLLDLAEVDAADPIIGLLLESLRQRRAIVHTRPGTNCWRLDLPGSWDEYLALLSKSQRKHVRRLQRAYFDTGRVAQRFVETAADLEHGFELLAHLHRLRWQSRGEPGVFQSPTFVAFHRQMVRQFCEEQRLRISWIELDGRPIAAEYQFTGNDTIYAYQAGMDPAAAEHQPGNLSMIGVVQSAITQGYRAIDLLRGDEPYKRTGGPSPRPRLRVRVLPGKWSGWLRQNVWATARQTKLLLDSVGRLVRRSEAAAVSD